MPIVLFMLSFLASNALLILFITISLNNQIDFQFMIDIKKNKHLEKYNRLFFITGIVLLIFSMYMLLQFLQQL
ncbi:hypothetical protein SSCHL_1438 [Staphylococcus schleiferi]|nr:hypothetical protein CD118_11775 [Staphylococcus coagulans]BAS46218.1 hypothetical protein SSCHL_1438 [Staphylococcus schleiferi]